jgi:hypothetical protein
MFTVSNAFEQELKKRIIEEMNRITDRLCTGASVNDYADYRHLAGQLYAYRRVIQDFTDDVNTTLSKR